jgi:intein/homing endonuclease
MRIKFVKGYQNKLLYEEKESFFDSWKDFALYLGVRPQTIYSWRDEKVLLPENVFEKLNFYDNYKKWIIDLKDDNWKLRTTGDLILPDYNENLAEFVGILLGDGNINVSDNRKGVKNYNIRISVDSNKEQDYLRVFLFSLVKELFGIELRFYQCKRSNCLHACITGKILISFFQEMGLKPGKKIINQNTIPLWVWKDEEYLKSCIRGLYDTDGSFYEMLPHWPGLFQLYFGNQNLTLLYDLREALIYLGYQVSAVTNLKKGRCPCFYISKTDQIIKFSKEIGFNNLKHKKKIDVFLKMKNH